MGVEYNAVVLTQTALWVCCGASLPHLELQRRYGTVLRYDMVLQYGMVLDLTAMVLGICGACLPEELQRRFGTILRYGMALYYGKVRSYGTVWSVFASSGVAAAQLAVHPRIGLLERSQLNGKRLVSRDRGSWGRFQISHLRMSHLRFSCRL